MAKEKQKNKKDPKPPNRWVALTGAGIQMGIIIFVCAFAGDQLDEHFQNKTKWFSLALSLLGIFISLYLFIKQVNNLND